MLKTPASTQAEEIVLVRKGVAKRRRGRSVNFSNAAQTLFVTRGSGQAKAEDFLPTRKKTSELTCSQSLSLYL